MQHLHLRKRICAVCVYLGRIHIFTVQYRGKIPHGNGEGASGSIARYIQRDKMVHRDANGKIGTRRYAQCLHDNHAGLVVGSQHLVLHHLSALASTKLHCIIGRAANDWCNRVGKCVEFGKSGQSGTGLGRLVRGKAKQADAKQEGAVHRRNHLDDVEKKV